MLKILSKILLLCLVISGLSGCVAGPAGCNGIASYPGKISATKQRSSANYCKVEITYNNTHTSTVYPLLKTIFFDASGNTIDSQTYYFDAILAGRNQKKSSLINCEGQEIKTMQVVGAYHQNYCYQGRCETICGVHGDTLTWND